RPARPSTAPVQIPHHCWPETRFRCLRLRSLSTRLLPARLPVAEIQRMRLCAYPKIPPRDRAARTSIIAPAAAPQLSPPPTLARPSGHRLLRKMPTASRLILRLTTPLPASAHPRLLLPTRSQ